MVREGSQPKSRNNGDRPSGSARFGTLYVVSTPIGNPDDLTVRALRILKTVALIASEDPVVTQTLLAHHRATGTVTSYGPRNRDEKIAILLNRLKNGCHVALVSDCGTPVIYDPGCRLIQEAHRAGIPVRSVPGPSALTAAVAISGYSGDSVLFEGHLPRLKTSLTKFCSGLRNERRTVVVFMASESIAPMLIALARTLPTRRVTIAQNLTKSGEKTLEGTPSTLLKHVRRSPKADTVTVVIEGLSSHRRPTRRSGHSSPA
ncbi:MAG TPA: ribosomal RNA small subunit methyltransferase I [Nitrospiraceae bacterium]|nr:ribosomal RNA small subunit methyltransferase I [Nitrospiraceae bacterium]